MKNLNRMVPTALDVRRTNRVHNVQHLSSLPAGKMVPLQAIPLLREDAVRRGSLSLSFEMMETYEILLNTVNVNIMAYLVPTLAMERFQGSMDVFNRSFKGQPPLSGESVIPFFQFHEFRGGAENDEDRELYRYMGLHGGDEDLVITDYMESYNAIWNYRATNRSEKLELRELDDDSLAPAFWHHSQFEHVVSDFDDVSIEGEVPLDIAGFSGVAPVVSNNGQPRMSAPGQAISDSPMKYRRNADGSVHLRLDNGGSGEFDANVRWGTVTGLEADLSELAEELASGGVRLSLANIELAKKAQAMAKIRRRYERIDEEWVIDLLMAGLSVPEQALRKPMLLAQQRVPFQFAKRYASDGASLTESVTNGIASASLKFRVPRLATGGVIMVVAEVVPVQLFERQVDPFFHIGGQPYDADPVYPDYLRNYLDPQKVEIVTNRMIDADHDQPDDVFGFAPMNHRWNYNRPTVGGRYYYPNADAAGVEARKRIWAVERENPTLAEDFFVVSEINNDVFVVPDDDPVEVVISGDFIINGNTQFGPALIEASDSYDKVLEKAPLERIEKGV